MNDDKTRIHFIKSDYFIAFVPMSLFNIKTILFPKGLHIEGKLQLFESTCTAEQISGFGKHFFVI